MEHLFSVGRHLRVLFAWTKNEPTPDADTMLSGNLDRQCMNLDLPMKDPTASLYIHIQITAQTRMKVTSSSPALMR